MTKKAFRLILSGLLSIMFILISAYHAINIFPRDWDPRYILGTFFFFIMFLSIGEFAINIGKNYFTKFIFSDVIAALVILPLCSYIEVMSCIDLESEYFSQNFELMLYASLRRNLLLMCVSMLLAVLCGLLLHHHSSLRKEHTD